MNWHTTLTSLSNLINSSVEENMIYYDKSFVIDNWLGFAKASEAEILKKEEELGLSLPKSYKDFLRISNGFRQISLFTGNILPVDQIDWLKNSAPDFIEMFNEGYGLFDEEEDDSKVPDDEYYRYDENQRSELFNVDHLKNAIQLSEWTEGSIVLLNPMVKFGDEFEAWIYANWYPGARRFKSFGDLVLHELESTSEMMNNRGAMS